MEIPKVTQFNVYYSNVQINPGEKCQW